MTKLDKAEIFDIARDNLRHDRDIWCFSIACRECPFDGHRCGTEAFYFLLKAFDELKEKYDEVIYGN